MSPYGVTRPQCVKGLPSCRSSEPLDVYSNYSETRHLGYEIWFVGLGWVWVSAATNSWLLRNVRETVQSVISKMILYKSWSPLLATDEEYSMFRRKLDFLSGWWLILFIYLVECETRLSGCNGELSGLIRINEYRYSDKPSLETLPVMYWNRHASLQRYTENRIDVSRLWTIIPCSSLRQIRKTFGFYR